jgi:hypothetical protein
MDSDNYKILAALAFGAMGGLMLGNYIWGSGGKQRSISKHLATLTTVIEQIENINTEESEELKERIENILTTIESSYGDSEEPSQ